MGKLEDAIIAAIEEETENGSRETRENSAHLHMIDVVMEYLNAENN